MTVFVFEKGDRKLATSDIDRATRIMLDLNGGGFNENQTAATMEDMRAIQDGEPVTVNDVYCYVGDENDL